MDKRFTSDAVKMRRHNRREDGFSVMQLLITMLIIGIVASFAVMRVVQARESMRLSGAVRELAGYLEQARVDSVRRRARNPNAAGQDERAFILIPDSADDNKYEVHIDFNKDGVLGVNEFRVVVLPENVIFNDLDAAIPIRFDWRGRTGTDQNLVLSNIKLNTPISVLVTGLGDVTVTHNGTVNNPSINANANLTGGTSPSPSPSASPAPGASPSPSPSTSPTPNPSTDPTPNPGTDPTPNPGTDPTPNPTPNATPNPTPNATPTPSASPTPSATPTPTPAPACSLAVTPLAVSVRKQNKSTATVIVTVPGATGATTVTATPSNSSEVVAYVGTNMTTKSGTVPFGGSLTFKIESLRNNSGFTYNVVFSSSCGDPVTVKVTVIN